MTDWPDRICERCQVRAVGVRGPDPHLCDGCQAPTVVRPPVTHRDPGDEDDHPAPDLRFDVREFRQSLIDQRWKGR